MGVSLRKHDLNFYDCEARILFTPSVDFGEIPPFVCIKSVYMHQFWPSIAQYLLPLLKQFSGNFINSPEFHLIASIGFDYYLSGEPFKSDKFFSSPEEFVSSLRGILEIFKRCSPHFTFFVNSRQHHQMDTLLLIASALELPSVQASENVHFFIPTFPTIRGFCSTQQSHQNLFKIISDWLHLDRHNGNPPVKQTTRSLTIGSAERDNMLTITPICVQQLIDILKVVRFFTYLNLYMLYPICKFIQFANRMSDLHPTTVN